MISRETKGRVAIETLSIEAEIERMEATIPHDELPPAYDALIKRRDVGVSIAPPLAAEADPEYKTRIDAAQVSWQFTDKLRPRKPQAAIEDLPLFGGERQEDLF